MDISLFLSIFGLILTILLVSRDQARLAVRSWFIPLIPRRFVLSPQGELAELAGLSDIEIGNHFFSKPLGRDQLTTRYEECWVAYPDVFTKLLSGLLAQEKVRAQKEGRTLDNNLGYSLRRIEVARRQLENGKRHNVYTFVLRPSDYEHFVVPNTVLDREVVDPRTQESIRLRELLGMSRANLSLNVLDRLPYHFRVGTGTVVNTCDGYWIISVRSNRQFIAPDVSPDYLRLHVSAAEGMLRAPNQTGGDTTDGRPDPFCTVIRALDDELNLLSGRDYLQSEIGCIGYYLDCSRAQPFLAFLVKSRTLTLKTVFERWTESPVDRHENYAIIAVKTSAVNAAKLLLGHPLTPDWVRCPAIHEHWLWSSVPRQGSLASNQARTVLAAAAISTCGLSQFQTELEQNKSKI